MRVALNETREMIDNAGRYHGLRGASSLHSALRASTFSYLVVRLEGRKARQEILQGYFWTLD